MYIFLTHIIPRAGDKSKRSTKESFHMFSFDDTEKKVAVRLEGEKAENAIYNATLSYSLFCGASLSSAIVTSFSSMAC